MIVGTVKPSGWNRCSMQLESSPPVALSLLAAGTPDSLSFISAADSGLAPEMHRLTRMWDCACRTFHRPNTSKVLSPSDKFAESMATGYHVTYPTPRSAVNDLP